MGPVLVINLMLVLLGCGGDHPTPSQEPMGEGRIILRISFASWPQAKIARLQAIDKVTAFVRDREGTEIVQQDLTRSDDRFVGRITVPAQDNLSVLLAYFDGEIVRYIGEDSDVDISPGGETVAEIEVHFMGTRVTEPESVLVGESFRVSWMRRPHATGYQLWEDRDPTFGGATLVYEGSDTVTTINEKAQEGTYHYRARAQTEHGFGPWYSSHSISVVSEVQQGEIVIDTPIPPDEPSAEEMVATLPGGATITFVWIEPGTFNMGSLPSEAGHEEAESPVHEVTISQGFYLGKYEITQEQWESVIGASPWSGLIYAQNNPRHPAVYISWEDMQEFIHELNVAAGDSLYRLPTEAEWEYACRAGTSTAWSFGDDESQLGEYAWYDANAGNAGEQYAHAVGTKQANPWGLYDMHGNVYEWCQDWYGTYSRGSQTDPTGPASGSYRVVRGGDFDYPAQLMRSAKRNGHDPSNRDTDVGARLLRTR